MIGYAYLSFKYEMDRYWNKCQKVCKNMEGNHWGRKKIRSIIYE